jgi:uncharacterized membrane protein YgcG
MLCYASLPLFAIVMRCVTLRCVVVLRYASLSPYSIVMLTVAFSSHLCGGGSGGCGGGGGSGGGGGVTLRQHAGILSGG